MLIQNHALLEIVGPHLPMRMDLLHELSDLLDISETAILDFSMSTILPSLCHKGKQSDIEHLAKLLDISPEALFLKYGHYPLAASFMTGIPSMKKLMSLAEGASRRDFLELASAIVPKTLSQMILQTGSDPEWNFSSGALPEKLVKGISNKIILLFSESQNSPQQDDDMQVAKLLADGDNVTRMLKEMGDQLDDIVGHRHTATKVEDSIGPLRIVRGVIVLIKLTGKFVGQFLPQFMVLLGAAIRAGNPAGVRVQGLIGWAYLIRFLATHAGIQLGGITNQVVVALLDCLQEQGAVGKAAVTALEVLVDACKRLHPEKLLSMPPIPHITPELKQISETILDGNKNLTTTERVKSLLEGLGDEALSVRTVALRELRELFSKHRNWVSTILGLTEVPGDTDLVRDLVSALMKSAEPEASSGSNATIRQLCAECLGILGAIDPSRFKFETKTRYKRYRYGTRLDQLSVGPRYH